MNPFDQAPGLAPRYRQEQDDFDLTQQVPREAMDNQYNRALRGADAGQLSQGSIRGQSQERGAMWGLRDQANRATAFRNRATQNISDRDMQWRNQQSEKEWQHGFMDRQAAAQDAQTKYQQGRDTINDAKSARQEQLNTALTMMSSSDPATRIRGEDMHDAMVNGGASNSTSAPSPAASAMEPGAQYNAGASPTASAPANSPRMAQYLKERDAGLARQAELDRQQSRSANADFEEKQFANSEKRHDRQTGDKLRMFQMRLDRTKNPSQVTDIMNQMAGVNASLAPMVNEPKGMMGIGDAIGGALKSAYGTADQAGQAAARNTFTTDPLDQAHYAAQSERETHQIEQQKAFADVEDARKVMQSDPAVSNAIANLKGKLATLGNIGSWKNFVNTIDSSISGVFGDKVAERSRLDGGKVGAFADEVKGVAESVAGRYGISPDAVRQMILSEIGGTIQNTNFDETRRQQFSDTLYAPPGAKAARFMKASGGAL